MSLKTPTAMELIEAIAMAGDAAQDAEDCERLDRASKFRAQARAMESELAAMRGAAADESSNYVR